MGQDPSAIAEERDEAGELPVIRMLAVRVDFVFAPIVVIKFNMCRVCHATSLIVRIAVQS